MKKFNKFFGFSFVFSIFSISILGYPSYANSDQEITQSPTEIPVANGTAPLAGCGLDVMWLLNRPYLLLGTETRPNNQSQKEVSFVLLSSCDPPCTEEIQYNDCWWHYDPCPNQTCTIPPGPLKTERHYRCTLCCTGEAWCHECNSWIQLSKQCVGCG